MIDEALALTVEFEDWVKSNHPRMLNEYLEYEAAMQSSEETTYYLSIISWLWLHHEDICKEFLNS